MTDNRDDALLRGAFTAYRHGLGPHVRSAGATAAHRTVRRRRRVRTVVIATVAAFLLVGPATAYAVANAGPDVPRVEQTSGDAEPPSAPPAPSGPAEDPPRDLSSRPEPPRTTPQLPEVPGRVVYLDDSGRLHIDGEWYPGGSSRSVNISPDGRKVTWVGEDGAMLMSNLDGSGQETVYTGADGTCVEPIWSGDGSRLLVHSLTPRSHIAVPFLAGGTGTDLGEPIGCHYRWSADGEWLAALAADLSGVTVMNLDGSELRLLSLDDLAGRTLANLTGVSADGRRIGIHTVAVGEPAGDGGRSLVTTAIVDVATGEEVVLPVTGALRAAVFLADGTLVRLGTEAGVELVRLDADDQVVARSVEPPWVADLSLLAYLT